MCTQEGLAEMNSAFWRIPPNLSPCELCVDMLEINPIDAEFSTQHAL